ncbi:MAG: ATP-binding protein [Rhodospirillaceae bacterium]
MSRVLEVTLENTLPEIPRLAELIEAFGDENGVPARAVFNLNLALDEILTNVVEYAFPDDGRHEILIRLILDELALIAEVIDDGIAYDPTTRPDPDTSLSLEDRPIGGLGVYFAKRMMDRVEYHRDGTRNRLTLVRLLDQDHDCKLAGDSGPND